MTTLADIQRRVGVIPDGVLGPKTLVAIAAALGMEDAPVGTPTASPAAIANIKRFEGCEKKQPDGTLRAYPDPASGGDPWTIGWGSTGPGIKKGVVWTQEQADTRLEQHVRDLASGVAALLGNAPTTQAQFDALVSFAYNVGLKKLADSTLLQMHRDGNYDGAAAQFALWTKAAGKVMQGLVNRRIAEARLYRGLPA